MSDPLIKTAPSYSIDIHMAGSIAKAADVLQLHAIGRGMCVTLMAQTFVYSGGREEGFRVGIINYPRFPKTRVELVQLADELADLLMQELGQHSYSIVTPDKTFWVSRREGA